MARYLPIALDVEGRRCVIVGGGAVAARRARSLIEAGAQVVIVAPAICTELAREPVERVERNYRTEDLENASIVISCTDAAEVNSAVASDARRLGVLCCNADEPAEGDFVLPATVRRGDLLLSVTTSGASPALAAGIRDELAQRYGPEYGPYVELLAEARREVLASVTGAHERRSVLARIASDRELLEDVRAGRLEDARARMEACISS